jgi:transcriptional repressor NrdR
MKCPFCNHEELKVTDSRNAVDANAIRRRRECLKCARRFTTFETIELTIQVHKRDGRYEDFQEQKLINGLDAACRHTSISHEQVRSLASRITGEFMERQIREISTKEIGEIVMKYLKTMDTIAYIRFACVYRRFKGIGELIEAIVSIHPKDCSMPVKSFRMEHSEDLNHSEEKENIWH